jgi:RNA polymerase sigma factor for flagellar operon FliA
MNKTKTEPTTKIKWQTFQSIRDKNDFKDPEFIRLRNEIATENFHLVIKLSDLMHRKHPEVDKEDLRSFASLGLLDAIMKFDSGKDIKFETFATYRLFGSMYDEMRKADWLPRLTRQRMMKLERLREKFISANGMKPTRDEIVSLAEPKDKADIEKFLNENGEVWIYSMSGNTSNNDDNEVNFYHVDKKADPESDTVKVDFFNNFIRKNFNEDESKIIWLVYYENRTLKDTANILGIAESRICPIHSNILKKLRKHFQERPSDLEIFKI